MPLVSGADESGKFTTLDEAANSRATTGMFGAGYLEMLARQMTNDIRAQAANIAAGESAELYSKGVGFGTLSRNADGTWEFVSEDRYATTKSGERIRLKANGQWECY